MPEFGLDSSIRDVLDRHPTGREILWAHGYDVGEGFVDVLSQYQSLRDAHRAGRLRDLPALLDALNGTLQPS